MATYNARRIAQRLYEYVTFNGDGVAQPSDDVEDFNDAPYWHATDDDVHTFDNVADLIRAVRADGARFDATGADWATDPDGSQIIDYRTGERECVSWHFDGVPARILARVIIPAVDAR